ncbi:putative copper-exporting P-type ATPase A [uncultured archaeon]|nr:putative copper-exporting P-type ATPase A [uncultured archaeon]
MNFKEFFENKLVLTFLVLLTLTGFLFSFIAPLYSDYFYYPVVLLGGSFIVITTLFQAFKGNFALDILATIGIIASVFINSFFAASVLVVMLLGGEAVESYASVIANKHLTNLKNRIPKKVILRVSGREHEIDVSEVKVKDFLLIKPGHVLPVDGIVVDGSSEVDESTLTGESKFSSKKEGSKVFAGTLNKNGALVIECTSTYEKSKFSEIISLVEQAQKDKAPIQRLANSYAIWFTPLVLSLSIISFLLTRDLVKSVSILVVSSPCPLLLATPIAIIAGIGKGAKESIIFRSGISLEAASKVDLIAFDKTGTVTEGRPQVRSFHSIFLKKKEFLFLCASIERRSEHQIGKSVVSYAMKRRIKLTDPKNFKVFPGLGVQGTIKNNKILLGSRFFLERNKIKTPETESGEKAIWVAVNGKYAGYFVVKDDVRKEVFQAIEELNCMNISHFVMITGDDRKAALKINSKLGFDKVYSNVLPAEKASIVKKLRENHEVMMVGDGINDAPALATASVGVALGAKGNPAAVRASDIALMADDLRKLPRAIELSKESINVAKQCIFFGLGVGFVGIVLSYFGVLTPVTAAFVHEGSDLFVVFYAARSQLFNLFNF